MFLNIMFVIGLVLPLALPSDRVGRDEDGYLTGAPNLRKNLGLLEVGERISAFPDCFINDHTVIYNPAERKWHMYGIVKNEMSFIHLTADTLTQPRWKEHGPFTDVGHKIWAPHIISNRGKYYMFYARLAVPREIVRVESADLWTWSAAKVVLALSDKSTKDMKNKDPMIFKAKDQWIMYISMMKDASKWVVGYSTSKDLQEWSKPQICFDEQTAMPSVESPFVVKRGDYYYLFLSARPWPYGYLEVFRSASPYSWKVTDKVKWMDWHAPEIVRDLDGKWYITLCGYERSRKGFSIWPLSWNDYLDEAETSVPVPQDND